MNTGLESVHYTHFVEDCNYDDGNELKDAFARLFAGRDLVFKALEEARQDKTIGKSLEAKVTLKLSKKDRELVSKYLNDKAAQWLIVSKVDYEIVEDLDYNGLEVTIAKAEGKVCPRCWNITDTADEEGLCERCKEVLSHE